MGIILPPSTRVAISQIFHLDQSVRQTVLGCELSKVVSYFEERFNHLRT